MYYQWRYQFCLSCSLLWSMALAWSGPGVPPMRPSGEQLSRRSLLDMIPANVGIAALTLTQSPRLSLADDEVLEPPQALVSGDAKKVRNHDKNSSDPILMPRDKRSLTFWFSRNLKSYSMMVEPLRRTETFLLHSACTQKSPK